MDQPRRRFLVDPGELEHRGAVPVFTDTVLITRAGSYTVTMGGGSYLTVARLVVGDTGQGNAVTLAMNSDTLRAADGITIRTGGDQS